MNLKAAISAILFASTSPVEATRLAAHFEVSTDEIYEIIAEIKSDFDGEDSGFRLEKHDGKYFLSTKSEYGLTVASFFDRRKTASLSNAALEVLAVVAYNQPTTKTYISQIRGVASGEIVESLVEKELLEEAGRLDLPGRPMSYITTDRFLSVFGLDSLDDLPKQETFTEVEEAGEQQ